MRAESVVRRLLSSPRLSVGQVRSRSTTSVARSWSPRSPWEVVRGAAGSPQAATVRGRAGAIDNHCAPHRGSSTAATLPPPCAPGSSCDAQAPRPGCHTRSSPAQTDCIRKGAESFREQGKRKGLPSGRRNPDVWLRWKRSSEGGTHRGLQEPTRTSGEPNSSASTHATMGGSSSTDLVGARRPVDGVAASRALLACGWEGSVLGSQQVCARSACGQVSCGPSARALSHCNPSAHSERPGLTRHSQTTLHSWERSLTTSGSW